MGIFAIVSNIVFLLPLSGQELAKDNGSQIVVAEGVGASPDEALKDAFRNAVRQVVGAVIDAETQVRNDELINDKVLTYSDGFIKKFDEIDGSKKQSGGLHRIRIKAEVERKSLLAKLRSSTVVSTPVNGAGMFAEVAAKLEAEKEVNQILRKLFDGFPESCINARVLGEPKVIKTDTENATLEIWVQVEPNLTALADFLDGLHQTLGDMAVETLELECKRTPIDHLGGLGILPIELHNPPDSEWQRFTYKFKQFIVYPSGKSKDCLSIFVGKQVSGPEEQIEYKRYMIPNTSMKIFLEMKNKIGVITLRLNDQDGILVKEDRLKVIHPFIYHDALDSTPKSYFYLSPLFMSFHYERFLYTPMFQIPFRIQLSLEQLKSVKDLEMTVEFQ
jgi:hypothetical protein